MRIADIRIVSEVRSPAGSGAVDLALRWSPVQGRAGRLSQV